MRIISSRGFQRLAYDARHNAAAGITKLVGTSDVKLRKDFFAPVQMIDEDLLFTISTPTVDRSQDTVSLDGWDLTGYRLNPVVLWAHDQLSLPIGRCTEIGVDGGALKARVRFVPEDMPVVGPFAAACRRMVLEGFISATSVGFRPIEYAVTDDPARGGDGWSPGIDFKRHELVEFSLVPVPANAEALIAPAERGDIAPPAGVTVPGVSAPDPLLAEAAALAITRKAERARALRLARAPG